MPAPTQPPRTGNTPRLASIDALRGLVMVLMALDHTRDFFSNYSGNPVDPATTTTALFVTRWITHLCAPVFVFLAGTGAFLYGQRGRSTRELSGFLASRGLWLILLELTLVRWGWRFNLGDRSFEGQVIWALGASMLVLSALVYLPSKWILAFGLACIFGHNAFDGVRFPSDDWRAVPWSILHVSEPVSLRGGIEFFPLYPLIPWIGVMPVGYVFGTLMQRPESERRRWMIGLSLGMLATFLVLRWTNLYGDPNPWSPQDSPARSVFSFFNVSKYPPSLLFLLATLAPALALLAAFEASPLRIPQWLVTFGRVPLFYYLIHLYLIHAGAGLTAWLAGRRDHAHWIWHHDTFGGAPEGYGYPLWGVYLAWAAVVALLYPACRWFAGLKQRSKNPWLSYL